MYLIDTTLRDGEQAPGVVFSYDEKLTIARMLDAVGVDEVEIGTPIMGQTERDDIKRLLNQGFHFRTSSWCRGRVGDIDAAAECGTDGVHISFSTSKIHRDNLNVSERDILLQIPELVAYAKDRFPYVSLGAQDAGRTDRNFLYRYLESAERHGAYRVRIADTVGSMNPTSVSDLMMDLSSRVNDLILEFHGHNDLGMATANSVTALTSGAGACSVTVNGLGERAGNASLAEVMFAMRLSYGKSDVYHSKYLYDLSNVVSNASDRHLPVDKPIVGSAVFKHETGLHTYAQAKNKKSYQIIFEEETGAHIQSMTLSKKSGISSLKLLLKKYCIDVLNQEKEKEILQWIHSESRKLKRSLSEIEVLSMVEDREVNKMNAIA